MHRAPSVPVWGEAPVQAVRLKKKLDSEVVALVVGTIDRLLDDLGCIVILPFFAPPNLVVSLNVLSKLLKPSVTKRTEDMDHRLPHMHATR